MVPIWQITFGNTHRKANESIVFALGYFYHMSVHLLRQAFSCLRDIGPQNLGQIALDMIYESTGRSW